MIVSVSRRTDIPAFYGDWLLNRLHAGVALARNPFNPRQVSRVLLDPRLVNCLVFWTKNPAPLLGRLDEIDRLGYPYYFHFTLTGCGLQLEPRVPDQASLIATFRRLADRIGPDRVLWRFDPIVFTATLTPEHYLQAFDQLARHLRGHTRCCIVSFLSLYAKCRRNLRGIDLLPPAPEEATRFATRLAALAKRHAIRLYACCDSLLQEQCGFEAARCIDGRLVAELIGQPGFRVGKDSSQRPACGCAASVDIGAYNTCPHGCRYCYANTSQQAVIHNRAAHDPHSPLLVGTLVGNETITERKPASGRWVQRPLF